MAYLNLYNDLSDKGRKKIKVGQVMMFDFEGSPIYLKIMEKGRNKVLAKRLKPELFLTPEEADERIVITPKK
jgi:hypothetical protein